MKEKTDKLITWIGLGIAIVCTVLSILFAMNNGDVKELSAVQQGGYFDLTYWILVALVAVSLVAILWFVIIKLANNFKEQPGYWKKFLGLLLVIVAVVVVSFLLSSGKDVSPALMDKHDVTEGTSRLIGAACIMVYILVIGAALAIVYSAIAKSFKK